MNHHHTFEPHRMWIAPIESQINILRQHSHFGVSHDQVIRQRRGIGSDSQTLSK
jgi:hypothetical protein